jgi:3-dehydroquinate synthetase
LRRVLPHARRVAILTDVHNWDRLGNTVKASLLAAELEVHTREMAAGEGTKTLEEVNAIHDWLLKIKLRRDDVVVGGFLHAWRPLGESADIVGGDGR